MLSNSLRIKGALLGVLFFCSGLTFAQDWKDQQFLNLLVYRKTLFGYESEADGKEFFLHKDGKSSPKKELEALIKALKIDDSDPKKNAYCRFPARVRWLKKFRDVPASKTLCTEYDKFKSRLAPKSISVVFSSYYLNNPASSFGHTFIRLGKQTNEDRDVDSTATELLDTGINYGAFTEGAGPVVFAIGGLAGWFSGSYNAVPYYYKVREYNDFETRDLWSYQLNMSQEEIDMVLDHIWELGHTRFDYFFLTENCSYHVLSILESARPTINLHQHLPDLYTIPSETLKALMEEGLVRKITFRPAPSTQFYHQLSLLSPKERNEMNDLFFHQEKPSGLSADREALVYDTALSLVDYKYAKDILKGEEKAQKIKRPLLVSRSKIPVRSEELDFSDKLLKAPHLGHGQKRLALSYLSNEKKNFVDIEGRFAFHDFLDNDLGYPPKTKLEVMKGVLRTDGKEYHLKDFSLVDVMMLGKWDIYNKAASWKIKLGQYDTRTEKGFLSTQGVQGGYGYSIEWGMFTPYLLTHLETSYISETEHLFKFAYGGDLGVLLDVTHAFKLLSVFEGRVYPWNESRFTNELRYSRNNVGVGAFHNTFTTDGMKEFGIKFFMYL